MFDYEKMSDKDQERLAEVLSAIFEKPKFAPNCGAPLDPEAVNAGLTWCSDQRKYVSHQSLGATLSQAPKGWQALFSEFNVRYAYPLSLTVVVLAYDPWVWLQDDENKGDN